MADQPNAFDLSHWHVGLRQILVDYFDESEIETMCFDLRIDYESLEGEGKAKKAMELIERFVRLGRIVELIDYCSRLRPNIPWSDLRQAAIGNPLIVGNALGQEFPEDTLVSQQIKRKSSGRPQVLTYALGGGAIVVVLAVIIGLLLVRSSPNSVVQLTPTPPATSIATAVATSPQPVLLQSPQPSASPSPSAMVIATITPTAQPSQRMLNIVSIKAISDMKGDATGFRLTVEVNGFRYSYPTRSVWADIDNPSLPISFPIEQSSQYVISLSGIFRGQDGNEISITPQALDVFAWTGKTERREYPVAVGSLTITYEITE